jgi:aromatic ring hydroxylase-like protein
MRKPVGDAIVRRANDGMEAHRRLWAVLGLDTASRKEATALLEPATPGGAEKRRQLRDAIEGTEDEVQAPGIQMNQVYAAKQTTAVVVEPGDEEPDFKGLNASRQVKLTTYPGYHLPHMWLAADSLSAKMSTLDLCGRGAFTLITGIGGEAWTAAAKTMTAEGDVPVHGFSVGFHCDYMDCYRDLERVRGVGEEGVVLVRPDHFVAWRCGGMVGDPLGKLRFVLGRILGRV